MVVRRSAFDYIRLPRGCQLSRLVVHVRPSCFFRLLSITIVMRLGMFVGSQAENVTIAGGQRAAVASTFRGRLFDDIDDLTVNHGGTADASDGASTYHAVPIDFGPRFSSSLGELADNNNRPWFQENKGQYERDVLEPAMALIRTFQPRLKRFRRTSWPATGVLGGSLMRVYRDTRFIKGGAPYKTNVGIQFRHEQGAISTPPASTSTLRRASASWPSACCGPTRALGQIRQAIVEWPDRWNRARDDRKFRARFSLDGGSLNVRRAASRPTILGSRISSGPTSSPSKNWRSRTFSAGDS